MMLTLVLLLDTFCQMKPKALGKQNSSTQNTEKVLPHPAHPYAAVSETLQLRDAAAGQWPGWPACRNYKHMQ